VSVQAHAELVEHAVIGLRAAAERIAAALPDDAMLAPLIRVPGPATPRRE
jgi:hypothetical protein